MGTRPLWVVENTPSVRACPERGMCRRAWGGFAGPPAVLLGSTAAQQPAPPARCRPAGAAGWLRSTLAAPDVQAKYSGVLNGIGGSCPLLFRLCSAQAAPSFVPPNCLRAKTCTVLKAS